MIGLNWPNGPRQAFIPDDGDQKNSVAEPRKRSF
jgi:hypothetical protein